MNFARKTVTGAKKHHESYDLTHSAATLAAAEKISPPEKIRLAEFRREV
jgi:hypothetical protein